MCSPSGIRDNEAVTIRITALCAPQPGTAHFTLRHCICMQPWLCPARVDITLHPPQTWVTNRRRKYLAIHEFSLITKNSDVCGIDWSPIFILFCLWGYIKRSYVTSIYKWVSTNAIYIMPLSNQRERGKALCFLSLKDTLMSWHEVNGTAGERLESVTGWRWGDSICQDQDQLLAATHKNPAQHYSCGHRQRPPASVPERCNSAEII